LTISGINPEILFNHVRNVSFRGGTALHKLYFNPARRYSEDIDLVQIVPGPIGGLLDALQAVLNVFLGEPRRKQKERSVTLTYRVESEGPPVVPLRLKVEINTREHFTVLGFCKRPFNVRSRWFTGECEVTTFELEELLATKVRAYIRDGKAATFLICGMALQKEKQMLKRSSSFSRST